jgi:hypothetical protein
MTWKSLSRDLRGSVNSIRGGLPMRALLIALFLSLLSGPALAELSCKEQVDNAFAKLRDAKKFRLNTTITNKDGTLKMEAEYVLPDRMHQTITLGGEGPAMQMIVVGKKAWSNQGNGWVVLPDQFANTVAIQIQESVANAPKVSTEYKCAGDTEFEGKTYALYQGVLAMPLPADAKEKGPRVSAVSAPKQQSVYVDKTTGLPVRNIVTPVTDPKNRLFDGTFTVMKDLDIKAPSSIVPN